LNSQINERERYTERERERERERGRSITFPRRQAVVLFLRNVEQDPGNAKTREREREYRNFRCSLRSLSRGPLVISLRNVTVAFRCFLARKIYRKFPRARSHALRDGYCVVLRGKLSALAVLRDAVRHAYINSAARQRVRALPPANGL